MPAVKKPKYPWQASAGYQGPGIAPGPAQFYTTKQEVRPLLTPGFTMGYQRATPATGGKGGYYVKPPNVRPGGKLPGAGGAGGAAPGRGDLDIAGYTPDIGNAVYGDWEYQQALADMGAADVADQAALSSNIKGLAVGFGGDLSNLLKQGLIDQATVDAGSKNEFSTMKELERQLSHGTTLGEANLAARGMLGTGALTSLQGTLNEGYQRTTTNAMTDLLNQIKGMQGGFAQAKAERRLQLPGVRSSVAARLSSLPQYQARAATRARWNADLGAYEALDGSGRFYNADGTPYWG